jgi:hypothetical protein
LGVGWFIVDARGGEPEHGLKGCAGDDEATFADSDDGDSSEVSVAACGFVGAVAADSEKAGRLGDGQGGSFGHVDNDRAYYVWLHYE